MIAPMAIISPLAEQLIIAGNLRAWHSPPHALETLASLLSQLGQSAYTLLEFDVAVAGGSTLVPYRRDEHAVRAIGYKGQVFDLVGKGAARIAHRAVYRLYPGFETLSVKVQGKPRPVPCPSLLACDSDIVQAMRHAGEAWLSLRQARALEGQTRQAAPVETPRPKRL